MEKSTFPKNWFGRGGEQLSYNRRASVYGKCHFRGPGANVRSESLMKCYKEGPPEGV